MSFKIIGLDKLSAAIADARQALVGLEGELGCVRFDPDDPGSIEAAVQEMTRLVDDRVGSYASNPIIGPMVQEMKERCRQGIIERAAAARLKETRVNDE